MGNVIQVIRVIRVIQVIQVIQGVWARQNMERSGIPFIGSGREVACGWKLCSLSPLVSGSLSRT